MLFVWTLTWLDLNHCFVIHAACNVPNFPPHRSDSCDHPCSCSRWPRLHFSLCPLTRTQFLLRRAAVALAQLQQLLQTASDILQDLHSMYLVRAHQVDAHFHQPFPPLPSFPQPLLAPPANSLHSLPVPSPTSSCDTPPPRSSRPPPPAKHSPSSQQTPTPSPTPQPRRRKVPKRKAPPPPPPDDTTWDDCLKDLFFTN